MEKELKELAELGRTMRRKQSEYFRTKSGTVFNECRDLERRFDRAVEAVLDPKSPGLFDGQKE